MNNSDDLMKSVVVYERHYALNWLTQYDQQEWDEEETNTSLKARSIGLMQEW